MNQYVFSGRGITKILWDHGFPWEKVIIYGFGSTYDAVTLGNPLNSFYDT